MWIVSKVGISTSVKSSSGCTQNSIKKLAPRHKQIFLQYVQTQPDLLNGSGSNGGSFIPSRLLKDLNKEKPTCRRMEWQKMIAEWINVVNESENLILSKEDQELSRCLNNITQKTPLRSQCNPINDLSKNCRICLATSSSEMIFLFEEQKTSDNSIGRITLLDKLNYCSCFVLNATLSDQILHPTLPQFICLSCSLLVENAYQLKVLCAKTEMKLKQLLEYSEQQTDFSDNEADQCEIGLKSQYKGDNAKLSLISTQTEIENDEVADADGRRHTNPLSIVQNEKICGENEIQQKANERLESNDATTMQQSGSRIHATKTFQCEICSTEFPSKRCLLGHVSRKHKSDEGKKMNQCPHCNKKFSVKCSLKIHMRSHTGERPYTCEICGKAFKTSSAASNHRITHSVEKDIQCSSCSFRTNTQANLRIHERIHSGVQPYNCSACGMKFRTASNLAKHMRNVHEKQKNHKCDKCDQSYFNRESLRKHSIVHTGLKPFVCPHDECLCAYVWYNGLKKHIHKQHANDSVKVPSEKFFYSKLKHVLPC